VLYSFHDDDRGDYYTSLLQDDCELIKASGSSAKCIGKTTCQKYYFCEVIGTPYNPSSTNPTLLIEHSHYGYSLNKSTANHLATEKCNNHPDHHHGSCTAPTACTFGDAGLLDIDTLIDEENNGDPVLQDESDVYTGFKWQCSAEFTHSRTFIEGTSTVSRTDNERLHNALMELNQIRTELLFNGYSEVDNARTCTLER